jgi:5-(carboxyamino)imidazole ribonucleotide synthase
MVKNGSGMHINKLGILGGGQLAKMLAMAAKKLGIDLTCFESNTVENPCAAEIAKLVPIDFSDFNLTLSTLSHANTPINTFTFETENIPIAFAQKLTESFSLFPPIEALKIAQDRLFEKTLFTELAIPTPRFFNINSLADVSEGLNHIQHHAVLKTRTMGYDGKGQEVIKWQGTLENTLPKARAAFNNLSNSMPLILESFIDFDYELSLISVRDKLSNIHYYPLTKNTHQSGILRISEAPFSDPKHAILTSQAQAHAQKILTKLNYVGVLAIEFFVKNTTLIANEMAPRVHNSGHWTIEGAKTSQFENHIRAVCDLPLGSTEAVGFSSMHNIISNLPTQEQQNKIASLPGVYLHLYGKKPKPNRKLGHITFNAASLDQLNALIKQASIW